MARTDPNHRRKFPILIFGLITLLPTVWLFGWLTSKGFRLSSITEFRLSLLAVLPIGGISLGVMATSGYFFAGAYCKVRPQSAWLLHILLAAAMAPIFSYYVAYELTGSFEEASFVTYLVDQLTNGHIKLDGIGFGHGHASVDIDLGRPGNWGVAMGVIEFVGSMLGGLFVWRWWRASCEDE